MTGYKVFEKKRGRWEGPYYDRPRSWKLRPGASLRSRVDRGPDLCGAGVNFHERARDMFSEWRVVHLQNSKLFAVWEVEVPPRVRVERRTHKCRTSHLILRRRLSGREIRDLAASV